MSYTKVAFDYVDASIGDALTAAPALFSERVCLITCLDSDPVTLPILVRAFGSRAVRPFGPFGVVPGEEIKGADLFYGFDELYLFDPPGPERYDASIWNDRFTTERVKFSSALPLAFRELFITSQAIAYFSDGAGLNIAAANRRALRDLERALLLRQ